MSTLLENLTQLLVYCYDQNGMVWKFCSFHFYFTEDKFLQFERSEKFHAKFLKCLIMLIPSGDVPEVKPEGHPDTLIG